MLCAILGLDGLEAINLGERSGLGGSDRAIALLLLTPHPLPLTLRSLAEPRVLEPCPNLELSIRAFSSVNFEEERVTLGVV